AGASWGRTRTGSGGGAGSEGGCGAWTASGEAAAWAASSLEILATRGWRLLGRRPFSVVTLPAGFAGAGLEGGCGASTASGEAAARSASGLEIFATRGLSFLGLRPFSVVTLPAGFESNRLARTPYRPI